MQVAGWRRWLFAAWAALALLVAPHALLAQEKAPGPPAAPAPKAPAADQPWLPFQSEIDGIRKLVAASDWKGGKASIDRFFAEHAADARIAARLPEIEDDLQRCLFQLSGKARTPIECLGRGATKYVPSTRQAEFLPDVKLLPTQGWGAASEFHVFDVSFDGEMTIELDTREAAELMVVVGFDSEKQGGYAFIPRRIVYTDGSIASREMVVFRLEKGAEAKELGKVCDLPARVPTKVRYVRSSTKVEVQFPGASPAIKTKSFTDTKYRKGFVALRTVSGGPVSGIWGLKISGKIDATFARRQIAEAESSDFRAWCAKNYDRALSLPPAVLEAEKDAIAWQLRAPFDCPQGMLPLLRAAQTTVFEDDGLRALIATKLLPADLPPVTGAWARALSAAAAGELEKAESSARKVIAECPAFAGGYTLAASSLLERGQTEAAIELLKEATERDHHYGPAYDLQVLAALQDGDLDRARSVLAAAAEAGTATRRTTALRKTVLRMVRGPIWKQRFEHRTEHFVVASDASVDVCKQVAGVLEEALGIYHAKFRPLVKKGQARVYVFSGMDSYLEYGSDVGDNRAFTWGVYVPSLRELCVFLHEDRPQLWNTVRHEAFHQYLHNFVSDAPLWFNEGYAQFFGSSRKVNGVAKVGQIDEDQAAWAAEVLDEFTPLRELFVMPPEEFMENADVHYPESWAVVQYLREPDDPSFKGLLDRYTDAILAGKSAQEAYDSVLARHAMRIELAVKARVKRLAPR